MLFNTPVKSLSHCCILLDLLKLTLSPFQSSDFSELSVVDLLLAFQLASISDRNEMELIGDPPCIIYTFQDRYTANSYVIILGIGTYFFVISGSVLKQQAEFINPIRSLQDDYVYSFLMIMFHN